MEEKTMTEERKKTECSRDRIAVGVDLAMDELVKREDPAFYDGYQNGTHSGLLGALVIFAVRRRSDESVVIEAVSHSGDIAALHEIWAGVGVMASEALAAFEQQVTERNVNGTTDKV
jgi:hypothetical protein